MLGRYSNMSPHLYHLAHPKQAVLTCYALLCPLVVKVWHCIPWSLQSQLVLGGTALVERVTGCCCCVISAECDR